MSIRKIKKEREKDVISTSLSDSDYLEIQKLCESTGATKSWILRGLVRIGLASYRNGKSTKSGIVAFGSARKISVK